MAMKIIQILIFSFGIGLIFLSANLSFAQDKESTEIDGDVCYVYVVDVAKAKLYEKLRLNNQIDNRNEAKLKKLEKEIEIQFPKFITKVGEEELTTKYFPFPKSKFFITASVFYTDESMASLYKDETIKTFDSMMLGIVISNKPKANALRDFGENAMTEIPYDDSTSMIRTEQYLKVNGRQYLIGLECDCGAEKQSK